MLAMLTEHFEGRWPMWLSPRQVLVCPLNDSLLEAARDIVSQFRARSPFVHSTSTDDAGNIPTAEEGGLFVDLDASARTLPKKIRDAQIMQVAMTAVLGEREAATNSVTLRFRDESIARSFSLAAAAMAQRELPLSPSSPQSKVLMAAASEERALLSAAGCEVDLEVDATAAQVTLPTPLAASLLRVMQRSRV
jgi:histidyl-tRNA synthetase